MPEDKISDVRYTLLAMTVINLRKEAKSVEEVMKSTTPVYVIMLVKKDGKCGFDILKITINKQNNLVFEEKHQPIDTSYTTAMLMSAKHGDNGVIAIAGNNLKYYLFKPEKMSITAIEKPLAKLHYDTFIP